MRVLSYEDWFDKYGHNYTNSLYEWLENRPCSIMLQRDLGIYDLSDFINEKVLEAYEDYVSDFEDRAYENFKESKCF